ncbi:copper resistance protein CopC [Cellulomonas sp. McL0617]|uniref:copper resistance CopC/CopD family protein n=1 Tax=Cellulomonas sp. McL0617 TaxID=3415675 RepID=UPI003CF42C03
MDASIGSVGGRLGAAATRTSAPRRVSVVAALAFLILALGAPAAEAHALLLRSDPVNGSVVARAPQAVTLWFDEEISQPLSSARLVDQDGATVGGIRNKHGADAKVLTLTLPRLGMGTYGVLWQVLAADDGHTSSGTVVFTVGAPTAAPAPTFGAATGPTLSAVLLKWARIAALAALVGALAVLGIVAGLAEPPPLVAVTVRTTRNRLFLMGIGAAALGAVVGLADLIEQGRLLRPRDGSWVSTVGSLLGATRWGHLWLARELVLLAVLAILVGARSRTGPAIGRSVAAVAGTVALVVVEALGSHAAAVDSSRAITIGADAVHIAAACLWLGAVGGIAVMLWPHPAGASGVALARACRQPFTRLVLVSVTVVLVSGLFGAGRQLESVHDLLTTRYGHTLLAKIGMVAVLLALGLLNSTSLHDARLLGGPRPLSRRLVAVEAGAGAVLLVVVGLLAETAPREAPGVPTVASAQVVSGSLADLVVTLSATPSQPGAYGFTVSVVSTRRPAPAPVDGVRLELATGAQPIVVGLREVGPGRYFGTAAVAATGVVPVTAVVDRAGAQVAVPVTWHVGSPAGEEPTARPVGHPLAPYANGLALGLVVVALVFAAVRRRSARTVRSERAPVQADRRVEDDTLATLDNRR